MNKYLKKLNKQESRFTEEYIKHGDRELSFRKAYPHINVDEERIYSLATTLLKSAHIQAELKQYLTESEIKYGINKNMLIAELKNIAFFDIAELYDEYGNIKGIKELKKAGKVVSEMIANVDIVGNKEMKVKLANKLTAIEMLSKMMGYYEPEKVRVVDEQGNDVQPTLTVVFQKMGSGDISHALPDVSEPSQ